ncbi:uncharacterized protein [Oscarella lobularis]|uniref:uncharacterized protein n=1 Tax=Oscarella lobularis TaxID=121494 RepID=UPI003313F556
MNLRDVLDAVDANSTRNDTDLCRQACESSRGLCVGGYCTCYVQYRGGSCEFPNLPYLVSFGVFFCLLSFVSFVQLVLAIYCDYKKAEKNKLGAAFRRTTGKILHLFTALSTLSRGLYFSLKDHVSSIWSLNIQSIYYPFLLCSMALLVCFWAEIYIKGTQSQFLRYSSIYYNIFCLGVCGLLGLEWLINILTDEQNVSWIFDSLWAGLILVVLIFFLVFGSLMFIKVKGAFVPLMAQINNQQLCMSTLGIVIQATFQFLLVLLLVFNLLGSHSHIKWSLLGINIGLVSSRIFELGINVWFACVLWNYQRPEDLWILNPRRLLKLSDGLNGEEHKRLFEPELQASYSSTSLALGQCWICYDNKSSDSLIRPCKCSGDLQAVHHDCLKKWILQENNKGSFASSHGKPYCKVCQEKYDVIFPPSKKLFPYVPTRCWIKVAFLVVVVCSLCVGAQQAVYNNIPGYLQGLVITGVIILGLVVLRQLAITLIEASTRARMTAMVIRSRVNFTQLNQTIFL